MNRRYRALDLKMTFIANTLELLKESRDKRIAGRNRIDVQNVPTGVGMGSGNSRTKRQQKL
jgi:hypothetical protein